MHVGETVVSTLMTEREFCVVESKKLEYCGVEVMYVNRIICNGKPLWSGEASLAERR